MKTVHRRCAPDKHRSPSLLQLLAQDGWVKGAPAHITLDTVGWDAASAARLACEECGSKGLQYHPFQKDGHYRVVGACPRCGECVEL